MSELVQRVGIGLVARGEVSDVVRYADDARRRGLDSVWVHASFGLLLVLGLVLAWAQQVVV